jgi:hypothetical protein
LDATGNLDFRDFALLADYWLDCTDKNRFPEPPCDYQGSELYLMGDIDRNLYVDHSDLAEIADWWLTELSSPRPPPLPGQASLPNPADGTTSVSINADLNWIAGSHAESHDIYFGTISPPPFIHSQMAATFAPGTMAYVTTYYWRIDEVNIRGTTTGTEWSFTTQSSGPPPPPPPP